MVGGLAPQWGGAPPLAELARLDWPPPQQPRDQRQRLQQLQQPAEESSSFLPSKVSWPHIVDLHVPVRVHVCMRPPRPFRRTPCTFRGPIGSSTECLSGCACPHDAPPHTYFGTPRTHTFRGPVHRELRRRSQWACPQQAPPHANIGTHLARFVAPLGDPPNIRVGVPACAPHTNVCPHLARFLAP